MVSGMSEINKMDRSIEPSKVSFLAAQESKLGTGDPLKDQKRTSEEKIENTGMKHTVHDEQKAGCTISMDKSRIPGTNSMSHEDASSCHVLPGVKGNLKLPEDETGVSVGIANNLKNTPSAVLSAHYITNWVAQRPHKNPRARQANAVYSMTNDETLIPSRAFGTSDPSSGISCNAAEILPSGSCFGKNHPKMENNHGDILYTIHLNRFEEPGVRENKHKGKGTHAVGAIVDADCKAEAFNGENSNDMKSQGRIISATADVNPGVEKDGSSPSIKPTKSMRRSSSKNKSKSGCAPPKKLRKYEASVLPEPNQNDKPSDITGEMDDDHKELLVAAGSVHSARENACSSPFWKALESFFAPITSQDLSFLKQQLNFAEDLTLCQVFGEECDAAVGKSCTGRAVHNSDQGSVKSAAFGRSNKTLDIVPPLFQRVLSALIDEDRGSDCHSSGRVELELKPELEMQNQKYFPVRGVCFNKSALSNTNSKGSVSGTSSNQGQMHADDGLSYSNAGILHGNNHIDPILIQTSQVNATPFFSFNCPYQMLSLDDKLSLELKSTGLDAPLLKSREEWINQEIKRLQGELYQNVAKVKSNLRKIEKAIKCEQDLEKRNLEEYAMDQLVEMAYKRMFQGGWRSKSSRMRKISAQVALPFVKRTLARCKQFEYSGRSIFSQHSLLNSILCKPPTEKDARPIECDGSMISKNKCKQARDKAKCKCSEVGPGLGAIQRLDAQNVHGMFSGLQETSTQSANSFMFNEWKKECLDQVVSNSYVRITNPSQVQTGFSGAVQPLSHPLSPLSGLLPTYNCMSIAGKMNLLNDIANSSSTKAMFEGRHGIISSERGFKSRDKKTALAARSASQNVYKSRAKCKPKRPLSRIGLQELSRSAQSLAPETGDQIAEGNNELPSAVNTSHDVSSETRSIKMEQLDALEPVKILGETEDLSSLLNFDEGGLLDGDSIGLDVPMDDLSEVEMFV